jgi:hypothetical protein
MPHNLRRLAAQLATQLPENQDDARQTVAFLSWLVEQYLYGPQLAVVPAPRMQAKGCGGLTEPFLKAPVHITSKALE